MDGVDNILYNFRKWLQARFFHQTRTTAAIALGSKKKPCIVFSEIYIDVLCVLDAFSLTSAFLFRPQLLRCRVAEAMVRSERYDFLLLWD